MSDAPEEGFEQIPSRFESDEPDRRVRPHRPPDPIIRCPNCDAHTMVRKPYTRSFECGVCGYLEER
jgi:hypothetical protein